MAFSQATITEVFPPKIHGSQVYLSWSSSSPKGTWFQVYINQQLSWSGQRLSVWLPIPYSTVRIDLGAVEPGEEQINFFGTLPRAPMRRALLSWQSGTYTAIDLAGYSIYGEQSPGGGIDVISPFANITAYPAKIQTDGFGLGDFGTGGWGQSAGKLNWTSAPLSGGTWRFAIVPYDKAGNEGTPQFASIQIASPPREPSFFPETTSRLLYTLSAYGQTPYGGFGFGLPQVTLAWNNVSQ